MTSPVPQLTDPGPTVPLPTDTVRRAALTVCQHDPDHARDVLDALGILDTLRETR